MPITKKTKCEACGKDIPLNQQFCPNCGWMRIIYPANISKDLKDMEEKRLQLWKEKIVNSEPVVHEDSVQEPVISEPVLSSSGDLNNEFPQYTDGERKALDSLDNFWGSRDSNNERTGVGVQNEDDGSVYAGQWSLDMKHGVGMECDSQGNKYAGQWRMNLPHGVGVMTMSNGVYSGQWVNGKRKGLGTIFYSNDNSLTAVFDGDEIVGGVGTWTLQDGTTVNGGMTELGPHGICEHTLKDGSSVSEEWYYGQMVK